MNNVAATYRFGRFTLETRDRRLSSDGQEIYLRPKTYETFLYLLEHRGHLVTKDELLEAVWADVEVTENALTRCIKEARAALGDDVQNPRFLRTLPRLGYEFIGAVATVPLQEAALTPVSLPSIVVLPFANLSANKENEYFSDGLADDIIDALTKVPGLRVIARTSAFAFRGKDVDVSEIGAKLKVAAVLEGSVREAEGRIRVSAQLIKTADQSHLWSEHYDRKMTDVFAIQDEISRAIVEKLHVRLAGELPLLKRYTENLEAYNLFLRGRHCIFRLTPESLAKGKEYLEQAIALDPSYALAHTGMAEYYWASACWGCMAGSDAIPRAKEAALSALKLDDTLAEAHAQLGVVKGIGDLDWSSAEQEFRRALEVNPASPIVHYYYAVNWLRPMGRVDEELSEARRFVELDPLSARYNAALGYAYDGTGQHALAIEQYQRATDLDPSMAMPHGLLADAYGRMGRFEEAAVEAERACELSGRDPRMLAYLAWVHGRAGRIGEARLLLEELTAQRCKTYVPPSILAVAHAGLGDVDQIIKWVEQGIEERDVMIVICLRRWQTLDPLLEDARYTALLRKMNLQD